MSSWLSVKGSLGIDEWEQSILQLSNEDEVASPVSSRLDSKDINIFGLAPLSTETVVVTCNHCSRPTLQSSFLQHLENCQKIQMKETKITSKSSTSNAAAVTSVANSTPSTSNPAPTVKTKKRKLQSDGDKPLKKSASEKPEKSKSGKAKVPLDLDRHCGVPLGTGVCMRAITCKNHSVAAKRAVEGRSQGYDILVQLYQSRMAQEKKDRLLNVNTRNPTISAPTSSHESSSVHNSHTILPSLDPLCLPFYPLYPSSGSGPSSYPLFCPYFSPPSFAIPPLCATFPTSLYTPPRSRSNSITSSDSSLPSVSSQTAADAKTVSSPLASTHVTIEPLYRLRSRTVHSAHHNIK